jgi:hypothetical protein
MPIASTAHISCSAPLASRRNAERELRPDLGHTRASSRHVPRANQQERSTAAGIFFSVQHTGRVDPYGLFQCFRRAAAVPALWKARIADGALGHHVGSADRGLRVCRLMLFRAAEMGLQPMDANASGGVTAAQIGMTDVLIQCVGEAIGVANSRTADLSKKIAVDEVYHFTVWYPVTLQFGPRQLDRSQAQHSLTAVRPAD